MSTETKKIGRHCRQGDIFIQEDDGLEIPINIKPRHKSVILRTSTVTSHTHVLSGDIKYYEMKPSANSTKIGVLVIGKKGAKIVHDKHGAFDIPFKNVKAIVKCPREWRGRPVNVVD